MTTLYQQCKVIAEPVVKGYKTDVTVHDRRELGRAEPGAVGFWFPRENGSFLCWCPRKRVLAGCVPMNERRDALVWVRDWIDHLDSYFRPRPWYRVECKGKRGHGTVTPTRFADIKTALDIALEQEERHEHV